MGTGTSRPRRQETPARRAPERDPGRCINRYGRAAYDMMLGDCLWHIYALIGKHTRHTADRSKTRLGCVCVAGFP